MFQILFWLMIVIGLFSEELGEWTAAGFVIVWLLSLGFTVRLHWSPFVFEAVTMFMDAFLILIVVKHDPRIFGTRIR